MLDGFRTEDWLIGISILLTLSGIVLGAAFGEPRAYGITALVIIIYLVVAWRGTQSLRLGWLLSFGLVAGLLELWTDWVHVVHLGSLVYTDYFGFRILASPSFMPLGWWLTVVQFGYLALRLQDRWQAWKAVSVVTVLGMALPPWYEELAAPAQAWHYTAGGPMLSNTPLWILFTYAGSMFTVAVAAIHGYRPRSWGRAILAGFFTAAGIMFWGVFWFMILA